MAIVKTITYENLPEENKKDPKILPFPYKKPFKEEIEDFEKEEAIIPRYASSPSIDETNATWWDVQYQQYKELGGKLPFPLFKDMMLKEGDIGDLDYGAKKKEGIMSQLAQMSNKELREFYGGYLVPYGYKEDQIMKMPMKELEYLFEQVMSI